MIFCPNKNLKEWKNMVEVLGEERALYFYNLNDGNFLTNEQIAILSDVKIESNKVAYSLKLPELLMQKYNQFEKLFNQYKVKKDFFNKLLDNKFGLPKEQVLLLEELYDGQPFNELLLDFISNYTYTVEINTAKESMSDSKLQELIRKKEFQKGNFKYFSDNEGYWRFDNTIDSKDRKLEKIDLSDYTKAYRESVETSPSQKYSYLTVPGGTNYTENEIATPAITPSIKGHAQFATDKGIGWGRWDDKAENSKEQVKKVTGWEYLNTNGTIIEGEKGTPTKTRRILEVQSDLFQKGRDKRVLTKGSYKAKDGLTYETGSAWIHKPGEEAREVRVIKSDKYTYGETFTPISSLPQDVLDYFKTKSDTVLQQSDNQFLQLLNKDNNWVTFFIKSIIQDSAKKGYEKVLFPSGNTASKIEGHTTLEDFKKDKENRIRVNKIYIEEAKKDAFRANKINDKKSEQDFIDTVFNLERENEQYIQELERVETEGFGALKPIYNFYENTVTNILKKNYQVNKITDEYGNTWNQISIAEITEPILLNIDKVEGDNFITKNDKIIWGHPAIGKSYASKKFKIIDFDNYKIGINKKYNLYITPGLSDAELKTDDKTREARENWRYKNEENQTLWNEFIRDAWQKAKQDAKQQGAILFASDLLILREFGNEIDKALTMSDELFFQRSKQRNNYIEGELGTKIWKGNINKTINNFKEKYGKNKVINTNKYLSELLKIEGERTTNEELEMLLKQFCEKFGIKVEMVNDLKVHGIQAQGLASILKSLIQLDKTASTEVFTEEVAHFAIELLGENNPHVKRLMRLIDKTNEYQTVKDSEYSDAYRNDETLLKKEAIGKLLAKAIASNFKVQEDNVIISALKGVYNFFLRMINPIVNNSLYEAEINYIMNKIAKDVLANTLNGSQDNLTEDLNLAAFNIQKETDVFDIILNTVKNRKNQLENQLKNTDVEKARIQDIENFGKLAKVSDSTRNGLVLNELVKQIDKDLLEFLTDLNDTNPSLVNKFKKNRNNFKITSDELIYIYRFTQNYKSALTDIISYIQTNFEDNKLYERELSLLVQKKNDIEKLESYYTEWEKIVLTNILEQDKEEYDFPYPVADLVNKLYENKTTKDSSIFRLYFGILRNSSNPIIRLVASKLGKVLWIIKNHKIEKSEKLLTLYNKVKDKVKFEDFIEEIDGIVYLKRDFNIQQLDKEKASKRIEFFKHIASLKGVNYDDYVNTYDFYNTLTNDEKSVYFRMMDTWIKDNFVTNKGEELPDDFIGNSNDYFKRQEKDFKLVPKDKWHNKSLPAYFNDPDVQAWYNYLIELRKEDLKRLPKKYNKFNKETGESLSLYQLPQISQEFLEAWKSMDGMKDYVLNNINPISEDKTEYGEKATDYFGNEIKKVPIAYFDAVKSPSKDLNFLFIAFTEMSKNYEVMSKQAVDAEIVLNRFEKKQYTTKNKVYSGAKSNDYQALESLFDRVIYSKRTNRVIVDVPTTEKDEQGNFKKKEVDVTKILNNFLGYVRKRNLAGNISSMLSSFTKASIDSELEMFVGKKASKDSIMKSKFTFMQNFASVFMDLKSTNPKNMMHRILLKSGTINMQSIIKNSENSAAARVMRDSPLMFGFEMANYKIRANTALSLMYDNKIKDGKLYSSKDIAKGKISKEEYDKLPNVYDNYYLENDEIKMRLPINQFDMIRLQQQIEALATLIDGQMLEVDKGKAYNNVLSQNLLTHRNWLIVGIDRRFKREYHDLIFDEEEIGYYRATGNMIKIMIQERALFLKFKIAVWDKLSPAEKKGVQRTLADFLVLGGLVTIWALLQGLADDDDEWALDFTAFVSSRVLLEHSSFMVPTEITALLKSPAASVDAIESVQNLVLSTFQDRVIDRGSYEGYTAREKAMIKLIPGLRAFVELQNPEYKNNYIKNNTLKVFKIFDPTSEE